MFSGRPSLQPVALRRVAPVLAAVTLRWLHDEGERVLLDHYFGVWAHSIPVPGGTFGYDDFATVDACPGPLSGAAASGTAVA